jgi:hypothetical protein
MLKEIQRKIWAQRAELRNALCGRYKCFLHETEKSRLESIRKAGLEVRNPGASSDDELMRKLTGGRVNGMVCLHPLGSTGGVGSAGTGPYVLLAVQNSGIPEEVTLDWSFPGCWDLAPVIAKDHPQTSTEDIFLEIVRRRGSVSCLSGILPNYLFILSKGDLGSAPQRWRRLVETTDNDVVVYTSAGAPPSFPGCPS